MNNCGVAARRIGNCRLRRQDTSSHFSVIFSLHSELRIPNSEFRIAEGVGPYGLNGTFLVQFRIPNSELRIAEEPVAGPLQWNEHLYPFAEAHGKAKTIPRGRPQGSPLRFKRYVSRSIPNSEFRIPNCRGRRPLRFERYVSRSIPNSELRIPN